MAHTHATTPAGGDESSQSDPELEAEELTDQQPAEERLGPARRMTTDDAAIIVAIRGGDVDRYRELIVRHQGKLIATLQQLVASRQQAEELAHQSFVDAYRSLKRFDTKRSFAAWLYRIGINNAKDWLKSHKRGESSLPAGVASGAAMFAGNVPDPERAAATNEQLLRLRRALDQLPYELREALILHGVQGLSYKEMRQILDVTVTALKNRVIRGRAKLRELMETDDD